MINDRLFIMVIIKMEWLCKSIRKSDTFVLINANSIENITVFYDQGHPVDRPAFFWFRLI